MPGPAFTTYGLTHIALAVKNVQQSVDFYEKVFGACVMHSTPKWAQVQTPGANDIIVFEENKELAGKNNCGIMHFGFRLTNANEIKKVTDVLSTVNAPIVEQGEFVPGEPFVYFKDPDGYTVEVWYESDELKIES
ncbi:VOC family protein [Pinibacter soli]|uniref:VOC family protein n=1 Tax=Pinibacter soli TaxID=3044211 RepID=A0ABT6RGZ3_9BACT|nr:VOC family protein [Pinibacter soli]MDI3321843.1 VOC family protein [Pinibacter soli]